MSKQLPPSSNSQRSPTDAEIEEQLMHDVLLLLEDLVEREETTVKLILNCLYDAGATNLINQKFPSRLVNKSLKLVSKLSKPVFKMIAWQWFKMNCPQLITDWLRTKIDFKNVETIVEAPQVEVVAEKPQLNSHYEVQQLRSQIKILTGVLISIIIVLTSGFLWAGYMLEKSHLKVVEQLQNQVKNLEASVDKQ